MAHVHKLIRDAVKSALTGLATTGGHVYAERVYPLTADELPAIRLYLLAEQAEQSLDGGLYARELSLSIEACAKAATTLDDTLDQVGAEIEAALAGPLTIGGKPLYFEYDGMKTDLDAQDLLIGVRQLQYRVAFHTTAPDTFL